jgi:hypothetical protein
MKLLRMGLLAGAGALAYRAIRARRGGLAPRFEFLDPHSAGFVGLGGARFDAGTPLTSTAPQGTHASAASAANDAAVRDDRDVVGSGIRTPGSELNEDDAS